MKVARKIGLAAVLLFFSVIFLYPILYTVYNSLLPLGEVATLQPLSHLTLESYHTLFVDYSVLKWIGNTLIVTVACVLSQLVINTLAGYALARFEFPGRNIIFLGVLCSMMVPFQFILTPMYINLARLKWNDHLISLIVPFMFNCLYIFMARQFFFSIPKDLEDAARVDGLGYLGIFTKIILPNSGPLLTSITILSFTGTWNSYLAPSTFLVSKDKFVLALGLKTVKDFQYQKMNETLAGVVILSLPILIMFLLLQKHFVEGVAASGIKG